jgi:Ran GTPase-activating protein (RanGAP) involved in mRNA processing and transport
MNSIIRDRSFTCEADAEALTNYIKGRIDVHLHDNDITHECLAAVAPSFQNCKGVSLRGNCINDDGLKTLAPYLKNCEVIDLADNKIGEAGAIALAP